MKEYPISFSAQMVNAILAGKKTQTRRLVDPALVEHIEYMGGSNEAQTEFEFVGLTYGPHLDDNNVEQPPEWLVHCTEYPEEGCVPIGQGRGAVGDRLWVREEFDPYLLGVENGSRHYTRAKYIADGAVLEIDLQKDIYEGLDALDYEGPIGVKDMPRWGSRILLEITAVRLARVQDISEEDAIAEGIDVPSVPGLARFDFRATWDDLVGRGSWDKNPWVWVLEFAVVEIKAKATKQEDEVSNEIREVSTYSKDTDGSWLVDCPHCKHPRGLEAGPVKGEQFKCNLCQGWMQVDYDAKRISLEQWEKDHA